MGGIVGSIAAASKKASVNVTGGRRAAPEAVRRQPAFTSTTTKARPGATASPQARAQATTTPSLAQ